MTNSKDTLKRLGKALRSSDSTHQALLRARLEAQVSSETRVSGWGWRQYVIFAASTVSMLLVVVITWPKFPNVVSHPSVGNVATSVPGGVRANATDVPEAFSDETGLGNGHLDAVQSTSGLTYDEGFWDDGILGDILYPRDRDYDKQDIVAYEDEYGQMLEKTTRIGLLTTEDDVTGSVERLFTSFGGHISQISNAGLGQPVEFTGLIPADSYFVFREQLRELVKVDKYMYESLNATDLIPSAITLDQNITEASTGIEALKKQISETTDAAAKARLEKQLQVHETQLANLQESREGLDGRVEFVNVWVQVTEIPGFWETQEAYDLQRLVAGYERSSILQQAWINVLIAGFWLLQIFSVTFWLLIPLAIWLIYRRRQRLTWRELE